MSSKLLNINKFKIFFLIFFPSLILGTAITEFISLLFMCIYIIENKKFFFEINKINIQKFLYILIIYILINFLINKFYFILNVSSLRSLFYFRFIILFLIILHVTNKDNFNYAFTVSSAILILLSFDIIFQYYIGYNIIGFETIGNRPSSFFGDELRAGSFISKFAIPVCFFLYLKTKFKYNQIFLASIILFFFVVTYFTAERMALISYLFTLLISLLFLKNFRKNLLITLSLLTLIFSIFIKNFPNNRWLDNSLFEKREKTFYQINNIESNNFIGNYNDRFLTVLDSSGHLPLFITSYNIWLQNKIIGTGLKTFRSICDKKNYQSNFRHKYGTCSSHTHNHFLEILSELGALGIIIFFIFFCKITFDFYKTNQNTELIRNKFDHVMMIVLFSNFIGFVFILSSGSFFNNWTSYTFWINLSFLYSIIYKYKKL